MAKGLQNTIVNVQPELGNRADFNKPDFDTLVYQKGQPCIVEQALMCPCKSANTNQQSNCKNCGGTGWLFINPRETRMVLQGMDAVQKYVGWSEELRGMVRVSADENEQLVFMDRITDLTGISRHQEVLFVKAVGGTKFSYAAYRMQCIEYIGLFVAVNQPLTRLVEGTDYTWSAGQDTILWLTPVAGSAITIRYTHRPTYHVQELKRETMQSFKMTGEGEKNQDLPISAYARRAHYMLDKQNIAGDRLLDNSYVDPCMTGNMGGDCGCGCDGAAQGIYNIIQQPLWNEIDW